MKFVAGIGLLVCALSACGGPPPTYRTIAGMQVWDPAGHFTAAEVDALTDAFVDEFSARWPAADVRRALSKAEIEFLDVHTYDSYGRTVAGTTDPYTMRMTVAARDYRLSNCALAHELVHYVEMSLAGTTDSDHTSWKSDGTYDSLGRVGQAMKLQEQSEEEPSF